MGATAQRERPGCFVEADEIARMTSRSGLPRAMEVGFVDEGQRSQTRFLLSVEFHQLLPDLVWSEMLADVGRCSGRFVVE